MKALNVYLGVLIIFSILISSCTTSDNVVSNNFIHKRKYNKGYFIDLKKNKNYTAEATNNDVEIIKVKKIDNLKIEDDNLFASTSNNNLPIIKESSKNNIPNKDSNKAIDLKSKKQEKLFNKINKKLEKKVEKIQRKNKVNSPAPNSGGKSQIIALILVILLGGLGIHRFYLGYIGIGVIQLLTAGGCGIWALIDLIRIITGDLKPNNGRYDETL